jgi:hypothetical protein
MPKPQSFAITVTITRSWTAQQPDGATALVLDTAEHGPIAFAVNLEIIELLRRELAAAEVALRRAPGRA